MAEKNEGKSSGAMMKKAAPAARKAAPAARKAAPNGKQNGGAKENGGKKSIFNRDVIFAFFVCSILFILIFPLPPMVLSMMLVLSISISLLVLLMSFYLKTSLEISSYPTILLVLTLFRLSLNVATTKLILMDANAGDVIEAFGKFVIGNNYVIGAVIFLIILIINFMVIVKGSTRIAEVAARFTLDAMPGKQMSIDADLNAGIIDEDEAKEKRKALSDEAEFYGAMDGASKFVVGDAVAGLIITAINVLGGIAIGVLQKGMPIVQALQTYTVLTIGDGLVSQIPALLVSVSAGMIVSKTASEKGGTGDQLSRQMFKRHQPLLICAVMLMFLALLPGFPFFPFATLASVVFVIGMSVYRRNQELGEDGELAPALAGGHGGPASPGSPSVPGGEGSPALPPAMDTSLPKVNPMTLEVGFSLVPMVDPGQDGDLVHRISMIRKQIKEELGFLIPPISIQDNIELANNEYRILVRGLERARGFVQPKAHLAINPGGAQGDIEGIRTVDPAFGFPATWITAARVDAAEGMGYTVVDAPSVITTHVTKVVKDYASDLLSREDVKNMLEKLKEHNETVVTEISGQLPTGVVHRVLQRLLDEKVPIHDLAAVLEIVSDYSAQTKDPVILCEFARQALKGHIVARHIGEDRTLYAVTLAPELEEEIQGSITQGSGGGILSLPPERAAEITDEIKNTLEGLSGSVESDIVLLVSPLIRLHMFRLLDRKIDDVTVLSYSEISDDIPLKALHTIRVNSEGLNAA